MSVSRLHRLEDIFAAGLLDVRAFQSESYYVAILQLLDRMPSTLHLVIPNQQASFYKLLCRTEAPAALALADEDEEVLALGASGWVGGILFLFCATISRHHDFIFPSLSFKSPKAARTYVYVMYMRVCKYVYVYVVCGCVYVYVYVHVLVYVYGYVNVGVYRCMHACMYVAWLLQYTDTNSNQKPEASAIQGDRDTVHDDDGDVSDACSAGTIMVNEKLIYLKASLVSNVS